MSSAETVKRIRIELNLDKKDFASKLGITTTAIGNYESGIRIPKLSVLKKMKELAEQNDISLSMDDFFQD